MAPNPPNSAAADAAKRHGVHTRMQGSLLAMLPLRSHQSDSRVRSSIRQPEGDGITAAEVVAWTSFVPRIVHRQLLSQALDTDTLAPSIKLHAATLFVDASGFTALTERLTSRPDGAELMCQVMNKFLGEAIRIVHAYGGDVIKFAGDALSVIFEATPPDASDGSSPGSEAVPDDATMHAAVKRAALCCFELHRKLHNFVGA